MTEHPSREVQLAVINRTGSSRPVPSYSISFEEIGEHAVNGSSIGINGASRDEAVRWLRSAANLIASGEPLRINAFDSRA